MKKALETIDQLENLRSSLLKQCEQFDSAFSMPFNPMVTENDGDFDPYILRTIAVKHGGHWPISQGLFPQPEERIFERFEEIWCAGKTWGKRIDAARELFPEYKYSDNRLKKVLDELHYWYIYNKHVDWYHRDRIGWRIFYYFEHCRMHIREQRSKATDMIFEIDVCIQEIEVAIGGDCIIAKHLPGRKLDRIGSLKSLAKSGVPRAYIEQRILDGQIVLEIGHPEAFDVKMYSWIHESKMKQHQERCAGCGEIIADYEKAVSIKLGHKNQKLCRRCLGIDMAQFMSMIEYYKGTGCPLF